jgi:DMSO/TMAO reductase YedYZ heme-binding membrane subunit
MALDSEQNAAAFTGKLLIAALSITSAYATLRYVVFGPVDPAHIPLYVLNKSVAWSALVLLGVALSAGPLARIRPHRFVRLLACRKSCGLFGFVLATGHVVLSLPILTPAYYPSFFSRSSEFTALAEITMAAGVWSWLMLAPAAVTSLPALEQAMAPEAWRRSQRWAVWAQGAVLIHLLYGVRNWDPRIWYGGMPPITLICVLTVAVVLGLRAAGRRNSASGPVTDGEHDPWVKVVNPQ